MGVMAYDFKGLFEGESLKLVIHPQLTPENYSID